MMRAFLFVSATVSIQLDGELSQNERYECDMCALNA